MYIPKLPDKLITALYFESKRQRKPMTEVLRDAVERYLGDKKKEKPLSKRKD